MEWLPNFTVPDSILSLIVSTAILMTAIVVVRSLTARYIRRNVASAEPRRRRIPAGVSGASLAEAP